MSATRIAQAVLQQADRMAGEAAERLRDVAADLHRNAPRGGRNLNVFAQPRSAPGEPPAVEFGNLLDAIESQTAGSMLEEPGVYAVFVNHLELELGDRAVEPRPLGQLAFDRWIENER